MIAVDTSALVAIVTGEPDAEVLLGVLRSEHAIVGGPTLVESTIVVEARQGPDATRDLQLLVDGAIDHVVAFGPEHVAAAARAWRRFGKGRHPAGLNYGDCLAYAVADIGGCALLYKGDDFTSTDIAAATPPP